jgi:YebC/PmpR family DNA-binding regulatory protein
MFGVMSGHSKWSTIKRQKGLADAKRGQTFTKLGHIIALAAKSGSSGDPESNPRLRMALDVARGANMPKENIQRAIDRGLGKLPGQSFDEIVYEGFGPHKTAFIVEAVTDNKNRTLAEIKNIFERAGGGLGSNGSASYMFEKIGEIKIHSKGGTLDDEELELIDLGAEDVEDFKEEGVQKYLVYTNSLQEVSNNITQAGYTVESSELVQRPTIIVEIHNSQIAEKVIGLAEKLEEHDDVQKVHANFDIPDSVVVSS